MRSREQGEIASRKISDVEYLTDHLDDVAQRLDQARSLAILLDFDGTLAPIVERPEMARIPDATRATLERLAQRSDAWVAILSGRAMGDVKVRVGLDQLFYAGNHGMEISGPGGLSFEEQDAGGLRKRLETLTRSLKDLLESIEGAEIEAKGLTTSIHYRRVNPRDWSVVERVMESAVPPNDPYFERHAGKRVHEIRPRVKWGKGYAASWLLQKVGRPLDLPIFLGDDTTDEDAFVALHDLGITARVEPFEETFAHYRVRNTEEVARLLDWLANRPEGPP